MKKRPLSPLIAPPDGWTETIQHKTMHLQMEKDPLEMMGRMMAMLKDGWVLEDMTVSFKKHGATR